VAPDRRIAADLAQKPFHLTEPAIDRAYLSRTPVRERPADLAGLQQSLAGAQWPHSGPICRANDLHGASARCAARRNGPAGQEGRQTLEW
jgi:hypothetical protein